MLRFAFGALLALSSSSFAQDRVRESDYLRVLDHNHAAVAELGDRVAEARAERARAGLLDNPTATYEREAPGNVEQVTWGLTWRPPLDRRRGAALAAAEKGLEAATAQLDFDRLSLRSELRRAFAEWALAEERDRMVASHLEWIRRLADQMDARAARGEESGLSARRLRFAALEVEAEAAKSSASATRARAAGLALNRTLAASVSPERPLLPPMADSLQETGRSDLLARRLEVEQEELRLKSGKRVFEFPELAFGWQQVRDGSFEAEGPRFEVSWPIPLFDRRQSERVEASARLVAAKGRLELATARAQAELAASTAAYARLRQSAVAGMETAAEGDRVVESAVATFRMGESRLTDLLDTLRSILSARLAALDLYAEALEAHRALELAAGRPLSLEE